MTVKNDEHREVETEESLIAPAVDGTADPVEDIGADSTPDAGVLAGAPVLKQPGVGQRILRGARRFWVALVLVVLLAISGGVTGWLYVTVYKPDQATNSAAADSALNAAKDGTVALLSYAPDTLDKDFTNAKTHLTGDFLNYYNQFTEQIVTPAAKKKSVKTTATIVNAAVSEIHPDSAIVLVFLNQTTTSAENPDGSFSTSSVKVGLTKLNGTWLIASFDPV